MENKKELSEQELTKITGEEETSECPNNQERPYGDCMYYGYCHSAIMRNVIVIFTNILYQNICI